MSESVLVIDAIALPAGAGRGITQTLEPIPEASHLERTVNGSIINLSPPQFQKYSSKIAGRDQRPAAFNGIWPGLIVNVSCISELWFVTGGSPDRPIVFNSERTEGDFTFFKPQLVMMVKNVSWSDEEWPVNDSWSIDLEEV